MDKGLFRTVVTSHLTVTLMRESYSRGRRCEAERPPKDVVEAALAKSVKELGTAFSWSGRTNSAYRNPDLYRRCVRDAWKEALAIEAAYRAS